jgi:DNA topoisomerase-6 subunit B
VSAKAEEMAKKQREISVAEFFEKNRHLLGFDNPRKALLTAVKEAVDNSLDACEEAEILPEINVEVIDMGNDRFRVIIEDNGPGIIKPQIPKIFAKLLYGSKFHRLKQSRGQQGIGISASVMYAQLTTGRPAKIISKTAPGKPANYVELKIDTSNNKPEILKSEEREWEKDHGTKVELDMEGSYMKGAQSVDQYLKQTAITNPHVTITYVNPKAEQIIFPRAIEELPEQPIEIKPHPYGVELGMLIKMMQRTECTTLQSFLTTEFSRVGSGTAKAICEEALILPKTKPKKINRDEAEKIIKAIKKTKIISPSTDCISPIGEEAFEKGLKKEINAEFYCSVTRSPSVYRGNPFQVEVALAYGGNQPADKSATLFRFANRVPLQYQQGACGSSKSVIQTNWKSYGLQQSRGAMPVGPLTIAVHIASVWVPFTSESKEAIAHYPEIIEEMKRALQEAGRKLQKYTLRKRKVKDELKKRSYIEKYISHVAAGLREVLDLDSSEETTLEFELRGILEKKRGKVEKVEFDAQKNTEFDEEFANIGKEDEDDDRLSDDEDKAKEEIEDEEKKDKKEFQSTLS